MQGAARLGVVAGLDLPAAIQLAGDAVAWQSPNRTEVDVLYRACWRLGAIAAPLVTRVARESVDRTLAALRRYLIQTL
jgi:acyl-coenzyme A synthetase/AMP-(fatty) acid ligase